MLLIIILYASNAFNILDLFKPKSGAPKLIPCILLDNFILVMSANYFWFKGYVVNVNVGRVALMLEWSKSLNRVSCSAK